MVSTMGKENIYLELIICFLKDFLRMVFSKAMGFLLILVRIKVCMKEVGRWELSMGMEIIYTVLTSIIMGNGGMIRSREMDFMHLWVVLIMVNGVKIGHLVVVI
jgi:hypothetical protein